MRFVRRAWEAWGHYNNAMALADILGLRVLLFSLVGAALTFVGSALSGYHWLYVWFAAIGTFTLLTVGMAAWEFRVRSRAITAHRNPPERVKLEPWHLITVGLVIAALGLGWQVYRERNRSVHVTPAPQVPAVVQSGPIEWDFARTNGILGISRRFGEGVWVDFVEARGRNRTERPVRSIQGVIYPDMMIDKEIVMEVNARKAETGEYFVPPRGEVVLLYRIPSKRSDRSEGLPAEEFLQDFGGIKFVFRYAPSDGKGNEYIRYFSLSELEDTIAKIEMETRPQRQK
jgi:hypothetical protein